MVNLMKRGGGKDQVATTQAGSYPLHDEGYFARLSDREREELYEADALEGAPSLPRIYFILQKLFIEGQVLNNEEWLHLLTKVTLPSSHALASYRASFQKRARSSDEGIGDVSKEFQLFILTWNTLVEFFSDTIRHKNRYEDWQRLTKELKQLWHISGESLATPVIPTASQQPTPQGQDDARRILQTHDPVAVQEMPPIHQDTKRLYIGGTEDIAHPRSYYLLGRSATSTQPAQPIPSGKDLITPLSKMFESSVWHQFKASLKNTTPGMREVLTSLPHIATMTTRLTKIFEKILKGPPSSSAQAQSRPYASAGTAQQQQTSSYHVRARPPSQHAGEDDIETALARLRERTEATEVEMEHLIDEKGEFRHGSSARYGVTSRGKVASSSFAIEDGDGHHRQEELHFEPVESSTTSASRYHHEPTPSLRSQQSSTYHHRHHHSYGRDPDTTTSSITGGGGDVEWDATVTKNPIVNVEESSSRFTRAYGGDVSERREGSGSSVQWEEEEERQQRQQRHRQKTTTMMEPSSPPPRVPTVHGAAPKPMEGSVETYRNDLIDDIRSLLMEDLNAPSASRKFFLNVLIMGSDFVKLMMYMMSHTLSSLPPSTGRGGGGGGRTTSTSAAMSSDLLSKALPPVFLDPLRTMRRILETFAGDTSFKPIMMAWMRLMEKLFADEDYDLKDWMSDSMTFFSDSLSRQETGYIGSEQWERRARYLVERSERLHFEPYRELFISVINEHRTFFKRIFDDPWNQKWTERWLNVWKEIIAQLGGDMPKPPALFSMSGMKSSSASKGGAQDMKPFDMVQSAIGALDWLSYMATTLPGRIMPLIKEAPSLILPYVLSRMQGIPLPRLEGRGKHLNFWLDDWSLTPFTDPSMQNRVPWIVKLHTSHDWTLYPTPMRKGGAHGKSRASTGWMRKRSSRHAKQQRHTMIHEAHEPYWSEADRLALREAETRQAQRTVQRRRRVRPGTRGRSWYLGMKPPRELATTTKSTTGGGGGGHDSTVDRRPGEPQQTHTTMQRLHRLHRLRRVHEGEMVTTGGTGGAGGAPTAEGKGGSFSRQPSSERHCLLSVKNISLSFQNVRYAYELRSRWLGLGFKKKALLDTGRLDLLIGRGTNPWLMSSATQADVAQGSPLNPITGANQGISIWVEFGTPSLFSSSSPLRGDWSSPSGLPRNLLQVYGIRVKIDDIDIRPRSHLHGNPKRRDHAWWAYRYSIPLLRRRIKAQLEIYLEDQIVDMVDMVDQSLMRVASLWWEPTSILSKGKR